MTVTRTPRVIDEIPNDERSFECDLQEQKRVRMFESIHFRPIEPGDRTRLQRFHSRLSLPTVEKRFHAAKRELTEPLARRFTNLDGHDEFAIVATTGTRGRIIGVGRYCRIDDQSAEVAFVVEDAYQSHGLGGRLMRRLRAHAVADGIKEFVAYVLPYNTAMVHLLQRTGPTVTRWEDSSTLEVRTRLIPQ
jgi:RimJ/RimL family protein N-acetyltransferase